MDDTKVTQPNVSSSTADSTIGSPAITNEKSVSQNTPVSTTNNEKDISVQFATKIIKEQESIIGPVAYEQAAKVQGLTIDPLTRAVSLQGDKKLILENLVKQYEILFGRVSIEICKEAVRGVISQAPTEQIPQILL